MTEVYTIITMDDVTIVRFYRAPSAADVRMAMDEVEDSNPSKRRLWDFTRCGITLPTSQLEDLAELGKSKLFPVDSRVAISAAGDLAFGLLRMYEVHRKDDRVEHRIFRSEKEALAWLRDG